MTSTICSTSPSLLKKLSTFLIYIGLSIFFNLNLYFLINSELITSSIAPLSSNISTVPSSCMSIHSSPIFTMTFLKIFPLSRLQQDSLSITLKSITNLLELESNWGLLYSLSHLNYDFSHYSSCPHILFFSFILQTSSSYSFSQYDQNPYNCNNSFSYLHL